jgi:hypothetical protein
MPLTFPDPTKEPAPKIPQDLSTAVTINMEVQGSPEDFDEDAKRDIAAKLASSMGVDPSRVSVDVAPMGAMSRGLASAFFQMFLQATAVDKMQLVITIKGGKGLSAKALANKLAATPMESLGAALGMLILSTPKVVTKADEMAALEAADQEFNAAVNKNKAKVDAVKGQVAAEEAELKAMKDGMQQEKAADKAKVAEAEKKAAAATNDKAAKKAEGSNKETEKMKAIVEKEAKIAETKKLAKAAEVALPPAGANFGSDPALLSRERIPGGQPCKILVQESNEIAWEFREFKATVACAEGYVCGHMRDIAAISYFKEGSDVSTEMSATVYYCAPPTKAMKAAKASPSEAAEAAEN